MVIPQFSLLGIFYCRNVITMAAQAEIAMNNTDAAIATVIFQRASG
jgi:hypothetical protein